MRFNGRVLVAVALAVGVGVVRTAWADAGTAPGPMVENLSFDGGGGGLVIYIKTTNPVPRFVCVFPAGESRDLTIDLPEATSRLKERYTLESALVPEVRVEKVPEGGGAGIRLRFALRDGALAAVEQVEHGLVLRFAARPAAGPAGEQPDGSEYRVGMGDRLEISVFGHDDLTKIVEVRADGKINYPFIGDVGVTGRTVAEIDADITQRLARDYLVDPQVTVDVKDYQSQWVTVLGEVRTPGRYVLRRDMRVIDLLAEAGGVTKEAGSEVHITRREPDGGTRQIMVDLDRLFSRENQQVNIPLAHGDIIAVGEKNVFYIRGEVTKPGSYFLDKGMTILKAITVAGGLSQFANRKEIELLRTGERGVKEKMIINMKAIEDGKKEDIPLQPNDNIIVPRRIF